MGLEFLVMPPPVGSGCYQLEPHASEAQQDLGSLGGVLRIRHEVQFDSQLLDPVEDRACAVGDHLQQDVVLGALHVKPERERNAFENTVLESTSYHVYLQIRYLSPLMTVLVHGCFHGNHVPCQVVSVTTGSDALVVDHQSVFDGKAIRECFEFVSVDAVIGMNFATCKICLSSVSLLKFPEEKN